MFSYLAHGGKVPSYGVTVTLLNFFILKYPCEQLPTVNGATLVCQGGTLGQWSIGQ
jgi:hypothetical protein